MKYRSLTIGDYRTNCYIVWDEISLDCAVIDPGYEAETIAGAIQREKLHCRAILLTHGHFDHVGAVRSLAEILRVPVYIDEKELELPPYLTAGTLYYTDDYSDGSEIDIGSLHFTVLETPGHTMGSVCLVCGSLLFCGDTLFAGSCGRTDLGGDRMALLRSLKRLKDLDGDFTVLPGHGPETTLSKERKTNPYMRL